jgi:hypothetical protein
MDKIIISDIDMQVEKKHIKNMCNHSAGHPLP